MGKKEDESELQMQGEKNKYAIHIESEVEQL
jgi:hypothetical protein